MWNELMTTDANAAAQFYTAVFETEAGSMAGPGGMEYTLLKAEGNDVAGMMNLPPEMSAVPPHWGTYFGVDDVDASAKQAESLGAKVMAAPFDVPKIGRMAVLVDPQGAAVMIFKPAQ
jgi:predicted enzyme related to lactoylglutathione lyase